METLKWKRGNRDEWSLKLAAWCPWNTGLGETWVTGTRPRRGVPAWGQHIAAAFPWCDKASPASTIKLGRIQNQNAIQRLELWRVSSGQAGTSGSRSELSTSVFPNFSVVKLEMLPWFTHKPSPDAPYFLAYPSDQTSREICEYQAAGDLPQGCAVDTLCSGDAQPSVSGRGSFSKALCPGARYQCRSQRWEPEPRCSLSTGSGRCVLVELLPTSQTSLKFLSIDWFEVLLPSSCGNAQH